MTVRGGAGHVANGGQVVYIGTYTGGASRLRAGRARLDADRLRIRCSVRGAAPGPDPLHAAGGLGRGSRQGAPIPGYAAAPSGGRPAHRTDSG